MIRPVRLVDARKVLVVRTDRLGDILLSTPAIRAIREASPDARIVALAPPYVLPALRLNPDLDATLPWETGENGRPILPVEQVAAERFDAAILLDPGMASGLFLKRARIPFRTGPLARPSSFLFLNRGVRQARSRSGRHQAELDAEFAPLVTGGRASGTPPVRLVLDDEERARGRAIVEGAGFEEGRPVAGIHPGSGDSALSWPLDSYAELGRLFADAGWSVAFTGAAAESDLAADLARRCAPHGRSLAGGHDLRTFFGILAALDHFVAPSTGPLHAAAALGVPVSAPYPPLPSQSAGRWGPRTELRNIVSPGVECPARIRCRLEKCRYHPCMERIGPEDLFRGVPAARGDEGGDEG